MSTIQEQVWGFLRNKGLPEKSCAAIMGNIEQESSFDPTEIEAGNNIGFGLFQWSYDRRIALEAYGTDLNHQLNFFWSELTGQDMASTGATLQWQQSNQDNNTIKQNDFINGNGNVDALTIAFCVCWERAGTPMMQNRINAANKYFSQFTGTMPTGSLSSANSNSDVLNIEATNYEVVKNSEKIKDYLFGRKYRIVVIDSSGNGIDVSELHCTFKIVKTIQMQPNTSEIVIYNLTSKTENAIMMTGTRVTVEVGYEGSQQFGLIFDGDILQTIRERENGNTFKFTIIALDSDRAINFDIANYSLARGQTARDIVDHIANKGENPVDIGSISEKLQGQKLTRGKVMFGKTSDYIRQIAKSYDLQYYMDNGELNLIHLDDLPKDEIFELNPSSGLIGTPQQTDFGINGQCLLNPMIKLNTLIHVNNNLVRAKQIQINNNNSVPQATTSTSEIGTSLNNVRNTIIAEAKRLCDDPSIRYNYGSDGEVVNGLTYYDCSSFAQHCFSIAGLTIGRDTETQWQGCNATGLINIDVRAAFAGDLVFWFDGNGVTYHVAIYGGNNDIYAARSSGKPADEQVSYGPIYGDYKIARPKPLIDADGGQLPSVSGNNSTTTANNQFTFRGLDKNGIYRIISVTYTGNTRGNEWYCDFGCIDQLGGTIPSVSS
ncbi:phage protein [Clostridium saccharoperbutylacetonicum]|uniref:phage protein n=1 Tax=Clostridium saccharoperbutylacetonicum TaxID=36745 RepID=UPI0039ED6D83